MHTYTLQLIPYPLVPAKDGGGSINAMPATRYLCNCNLHTHPQYVCCATWFNDQAQSSAFGGSDEHDVFEYLPRNPPRPDPEALVHPAVREPIPPGVLPCAS